MSFPDISQVLFNLTLPDSGSYVSLGSQFSITYDLSQRVKIDRQSITPITLETEEETKTALTPLCGLLVTTADALLNRITTNTGATDGTYAGLTATTGGSGSGAVFTVVVSGGEVTNITVTTAGLGYKEGDVLTILKSDIGNPTTDLVITLQAADITTTLSLEAFRTNYRAVLGQTYQSPSPDFGGLAGITHVTLPYNDGKTHYWFCRPTKTDWRLVYYNEAPANPSSDGHAIMEGYISDDSHLYFSNVHTDFDNLSSAGIHLPISQPLAPNIYHGYRVRHPFGGHFISSFALGNQSVHAFLNSSQTITLPSGFQSYTIISGPNGNLQPDDGLELNWFWYTPTIKEPDSFTFTVDDGLLVTTPNALYASITTNTSGATDGTYAGLTATTGGSGNGAVFTVIVSNGAVTNITVTTAGSGYKVGDVLTILKSDIGNPTTDLKITLQADDIPNFGAMQATVSITVFDVNELVNIEEGNTNAGLGNILDEFGEYPQVPGPGEETIYDLGPGGGGGGEVVKVTCGANTSGITLKQTATITVPLEPLDFESYVLTGPSNGSVGFASLYDENFILDHNELVYTPNDGFVGDDSFTYTYTNTDNIESSPATVNITVLPTLSFYRTEYIDDSTILYGPSDLSTSLDMSSDTPNPTISVYSKTSIVQGNQTIIIKGDFTNHKYTISDEVGSLPPVLQTLVLYADVVLGTEYEMSFIYSVDKGNAKINLHADAWDFSYKYINELGNHEDANQEEQTFTKTFIANKDKADMMIDFQNLFTESNATLTVKNFIVQEVAAARKTKMKAPLVVSNGKASKDAAATVNARNALKQEIDSVTDLVQKKLKRREALKTMFNNDLSLKQIPMTRTELGISSDKLKRENVVVVKSGETIDVSAVNSADESFYCPLANDGDEITLSKDGGSFTVKRQDTVEGERYALLDLVNVATITKGDSSYLMWITTPAELGELVENNLISVKFNNGETIDFFIGSVGDGSETESSGASGDPFLVTLL